MAKDKWIQRQYVGGTGEPTMRLGRNVNHDPRNWYYLSPTPPVPPQDVKHKFMLPPLDQGNLGSCTGNAMTHCLMTDKFWVALNTRQQGSLDEVTAVDIYALGTQLDGFPGQYRPTDTGCDGPSVSKAGQQMGYSNGYTHAMGLNNVLVALIDRAGITGTPWYNSMFTPDKDGRVHVEKASGLAGGHETCVFGVDVARRRVWIRNSWGPAWGGDSTSEMVGCFYITWEDYDSLLHDDGDFTQPVPLTALEPMPKPPAPAALYVPQPSDRALRIVGDRWAAHPHTAIAENHRMKIAYEAWRIAYDWDVISGT